MRLTYVGHATCLIETGGVALLTDPLLRARVSHVNRIVPAFGGELAPDAILISHAHRDHLDLPSLRCVRGQVIAPPAAAEVIRRTGREVTAVEPGQELRIGDVTVTATHAAHDGRRMPFGEQRAAVGYVVAGEETTYFAGDTDVFDGMRSLARRLDVALLPVWGWGPRVGPGHLDPERAARAAALLGPRVAVPIHWGTYASPRVWWRGDPDRFAREFARLAAAYAPGVAVATLNPGEAMSWPGRTSSQLAAG